MIVQAAHQCCYFTSEAAQPPSRALSQISTLNGLRKAAYRHAPIIDSRESHWQSRVLRNDTPLNVETARNSLSQWPIPQLRSLTGGVTAQSRLSHFLLWYQRLTRGSRVDSRLSIGSKTSLSAKLRNRAKKAT